MSERSQTDSGTVLIVDDDAANRKLLADLVLREGATAVLASGGNEALAIIARQPVDLVLLDLMMPDMNGIAVLVELQKQRKLPILPVVVITANEDRRLRIDALTAGAIDLLTKPIDRLEVACKVRALIELKKLRERQLNAVEHALLESDHRRRLAFEQSPVASIDWDTALRVTAWNTAAETLFEYSREEVLGRHIGFLFPESPGVPADGSWIDAGDSLPAGFTWHNRSAGGRSILCEWRNAPLTSRTGTPLGFSSVVLDMTERKRLQEALFQSQKMDAIGRLAGGIAHDFNNLLSIILSFATFVRDNLPNDAPCREDIGEVLKAADRGAALTRHLMTFSRQEATTRKPTDINERLSQLRKILERTVGAHIRLVITLAARPVIVNMDPVHFDQIALNLAANARDAMPDGGQLRITLAHRTATESGQCDTARLIVSDTGVGIAAASLPHIFEPFFTTKDSAHGTGFGLSICYAIAKENDGSLHVESSEGHGTVFTLELPCSNRAEALPAEQQPGEVPAGNGRTVLIAEDEPALLRVAQRVLENAGYQVHVAADGNEAIILIDELGDALDIIVSDVVMPVRNGYDVAEHAARVAPQAQVILTSGYIDEAARSQRRHDLPVLWKPVSPAQLVEAVGRALMGQGAPAGLPAAQGAERVSALPLPKYAAPAAATPPAGRQTRAAHGHQARILIVEDDDALGAASTRVLTGAGYSVVLAQSLAEARAAISAGSFDALLVDLALPDGNGLELLREQRSRQSDTPFIIATGNPSVDTATEAIHERVCEYLIKPFAPDEIIHVMGRAIEGNRSERLRRRLISARFDVSEFVDDVRGTEAKFASALRQIRMVFQPIVRGLDGSLFGYEALLRSDEPTLATPPRLLAAAEVLGQIDTLGKAIRAAVAATLKSQPDRLETIFVNLHPAELRADLLADPEDPLLPMARQIVLEITERAALENPGGLAEELRRIRALGYRLAVDDLGEGYASLSSLVNLRPDIAKIDMSLVRDIHLAPMKQDVLSALVSMARRANIIVVAEGIEKTEERDVLVGLGCELLQGYLFARPGPPFPLQLFPPSPARQSVIDDTQREMTAGLRGRVLVVDDDEHFGRSVKRMLHADHDVVLATSAADTLSLLATGERFDLILSDLNMPGTDGVALYEAVMANAPAQAARMMFLTGGAFSTRIKRFLAANQGRCLEKPVSRERLLEIASSFVNAGPVPAGD